MIKIISAVGAFAVVSSAVIILVACSSHTNPLVKVSKKNAAKFLVKASQFAEKKLNVFQAPGGAYFGECMNQKLAKALCAKLFDAMSRYAASSADFKAVTVEDITDKKLYSQINETYQRERFNAV